MQKIFESDHINFVKVSDELVDDYLTMVNDMNVSKFITKEPKTRTREEELAWVQKKLDKNSIIFSMIEKDTNEFIGNIELMDIDDNSCILGISITASKQDKHYGTEAIKRIINYAFDDLNLNKVNLNVYSNNERAIHCYEKIGFKRYDIVKNTGIIDGNNIDDIRMTIERGKE